MATQGFLIVLVILALASGGFVLFLYGGIIWHGLRENPKATLAFIAFVALGVVLQQSGWVPERHY